MKTKYCARAVRDISCILCILVTHFNYRLIQFLSFCFVSKGIAQISNNAPRDRTIFSVNIFFQRQKIPERSHLIKQHERPNCIYIKNCAVSLTGAKKSSRLCSISSSRIYLYIVSLRNLFCATRRRMRRPRTTDLLPSPSAQRITSFHYTSAAREERWLQANYIAKAINVSPLLTSPLFHSVFLPPYTEFYAPCRAAFISPPRCCSSFSFFNFSRRERERKGTRRCSRAQMRAFIIAALAGTI